jgi:hypothetical protein
MNTEEMFLDCPAYMDEHGMARCGLPAAVEYRYTVSSTEGPLESAKIQCPRGHGFNGPMRSLTWEKHSNAPAPAINSSLLKTARKRRSSDLVSCSGQGSSKGCQPRLDGQLEN